jgi:hypothetical protein
MLMSLMHPQLLDGFSYESQKKRQQKEKELKGVPWLAALRG